MVILVLSSVAGCLLGNSLSTFMMDKLWDYFQPAGILTYVASTGIVLWLACVMIGSKVYHAASANPILSLKEE